MDVVEFVKHDAKPPANAVQQAAVQTEKLALGDLRDRYVEECRGSLEANTVALLEIHFRHLVRTLGERMPLDEITHDALRRHVSSRKGKVSATTIRKELITLRSAWNWGMSRKVVPGFFLPLKDVKLPKTDETPPYQTWAEAKQTGQWDCLYLTVEETGELLAHIKATASQPCLYPMCVLATYSIRMTSSSRSSTAS